MPRTMVRPATLRDLDLLVLHRRKMWQDIGGRTRKQLDAADPVYRRWARQRLKSGKLVGWIVEVGGTPVASGCLWVQEAQPRPAWKGTRQAYLLSVFTAPEHRGKGFASRITGEAMRWSKAAGLDRITLHASDEGRGLYARLGFLRTREMRLLLKPRPRRRLAKDGPTNLR